MTLPGRVIEFLCRPNAAVIGCVRPDGFPMTAATWYAYDSGRILVNMDERRSRLAWMRANPRVSLTALDADWYRHVTVYGTVVEFTQDRELKDIDLLARHYTGKPFGSRSARRVSAWIEPAGWHVWDPSGELSGE